MHSLKSFDRSSTNACARIHTLNSEAHTENDRVLPFLIFQKETKNWSEFESMRAHTHTNQCTISRFVHSSKWHFDLLAYWKIFKNFINSKRDEKKANIDIIKLPAKWAYGLKERARERESEGAWIKKSQQTKSSKIIIIGEEEQTWCKGAYSFSITAATIQVQRAES